MPNPELTPSQKLDIAAANALTAVTELFTLAGSAAKTGVKFLNSSVEYAGEFVEWGKDNVKGFPKSITEYPEYYTNGDILNPGVDSFETKKDTYNVGEIAGYDMMTAALVLSIDQLEAYYTPVLSEHRRLKTMEASQNDGVSRALRDLEREIADGESKLAEWPTEKTTNKEGRQVKIYVNVDARKKKEQKLISQKTAVALFKEKYQSSGKVKPPQFSWTESPPESGLYAWRVTFDESKAEVSLSSAKYEKLIKNEVDKYKKKLEEYKSEQNKVMYRHSQLISGLSSSPEVDAVLSADQKRERNEAIEAVNSNIVAIKINLNNARSAFGSKSPKFKESGDVLPLIELLKK